MSKKNDREPWKWLDNFRGKAFDGQWPSLPELFRITASRFPDRKCWECFYPVHEIYTYSQALEIVNRVASNLVDLGVKKGDTVGLTGRNSPQWAMAYMGILSMGAIVAPVDYSLTPEEIEHFMDFVQVKGLFVEGEHFDKIGKEGKYNFKISLTPDVDPYIMNLPASSSEFDVPCESDDAAFLFTSGTTGVPKAVQLTHANFTSDCLYAQSWMNIYPEDVFYAILPIHHAYTMLAVFIESFSVGANLIFGKRLIVSQLLKEMKEGHVTMFLAVPMIYNKLLAGVMKGIKEKGWAAEILIKTMMAVSGFTKKVFGINPGKKMFGAILDKISLKDNRICIAGGGPLPPKTFRQFNELGIDFVQGYGLTETSPILTLNPIFDYEEKSIGKCLPDVDMKFVNKDEDGNGEICVKGSMVMKGYYKNPEATNEIIDEDGYLHTGDVGYMDKRGFVYLTGRAKNIIVTEGGKNVFPEEIEDHFQLFDDIEQICVVGYTLDAVKKTEGIAALIYPSSGCSRKISDSLEMQKHIEGIVDSVNKDILPYKRIRKVIVIDEPMEQTSTKKIKRPAVKKKYANLLK